VTLSRLWRSFAIWGAAKSPWWLMIPNDGHCCIDKDGKITLSGLGWLLRLGWLWAVLILKLCPSQEFNDS
jgi:hypothetical protein